MVSSELIEGVVELVEDHIKPGAFGALTSWLGPRVPYSSFYSKMCSMTSRISQQNKENLDPACTRPLNPTRGRTPHTNLPPGSLDLDHLPALLPPQLGQLAEARRAGRDSNKGCATLTSDKIANAAGRRHCAA